MRQLPRERDALLIYAAGFVRSATVSLDGVTLAIHVSEAGFSTTQIGLVIGVRQIVAPTHKLNLELDTSVSVFNWLREGRWLRGVELEGSLDYVATGLPQAGELVDGRRYIDKASPWSFSLVFVLPVAPM